MSGYNGTEEVEYGEYPQNVLDYDKQKRLEIEYQSVGLKTTDRNYAFEKTKCMIIYNVFNQKNMKNMNIQAKNRL